MRPTSWSLLAAGSLLLISTTVSHAEVVLTCSQQAPASLTIDPTSASYVCGKNPALPYNLNATSNRFIVDVNTLTLVINTKAERSNSSIVEDMTFEGVNQNALRYSESALDFLIFSKLKSLVFQNVALQPFEIFKPSFNDVGATVIKLPSSVTNVSFENATLSDLSFNSTGTGLKRITFNNTNFTKVPQFLYEKPLPETNIKINLLSVDDDAPINITEKDFKNLEANVQDLDDIPPFHLCDHTLANGVITVPCNSGSGSHKDSSGLSTGILVVIIVAVVVIAVILVYLILRMYFKRKAATANAQNDATATLMGKGDTSGDKGSFISSDEYLRNFRLPQSDVSLVKSMGTGRLWMGEHDGGKVIVKRVESEVTDSFVTKALMAQARTLATISHPNITNLVGVTWLAGTDFAVVTEFMDKGNLKTVLANKDIDLDVGTKVQMCLDVALALTYLHETDQNLCVKQLSSRKVLVDKTLSCKLSLFECVPVAARLGGPNVTSYSYGMGEVVWLAPEVITRSSPKDPRKNNIFAFGVLVSEIFTRMSPYQSLVEEQGNTMSDVELVKRVRRLEPLTPHENRKEFLEAPEVIRQLVEQCLSYAATSRPSAKDLVDMLLRAKEELVIAIM